MDDITELINSGKPITEIIDGLKQKTMTELPSWDNLLKEYEPKQHRIVNDKIGRKDREKADGTIDPAARIHIGIEKLLTKRMQEFMFAIPVKRIAHNTEDSDTRQQIATAIERIYKTARIDSENIKRSRAYFASCEIFTLWYLVEPEGGHDLYGFHTPYKLKCRTYSPMDGCKLYPFFDDTEDLQAMSVEYKKKVGTEEHKYFETWTATDYYKWKCTNAGWEEVEHQDNPIGKIPGVYAFRPVPIWDGLSHIRENIEYTVSRHSDVVDYNSAPVLKVCGEITTGDGTDKDSPYNIFHCENGGDVSYVSWAQGMEAVKYHVDTLLDMIFKLAQLPDISFKNMASLGNIGYDARQTMLMDAHLKVGDESGTWIEAFERECNVVKAFLKMMNVKWKNEIDQVDIEQVITPFIQNNESAEIDKWIKASGGKAVISQLSAIKQMGLVQDAEEELNQIQQEDTASKMSAMADIFAASAE